jgi:cysteine sulfinate desulfinase/cysteine desulfurase-like protein
MLMGIGADSIVYVKSDKNGKMMPDQLEKAIEATKAAGKVPFFVNATAGTTVLGSFDDIERIADICEKFGLWLNVDVSLKSKVGELNLMLKSSTGRMGRIGSPLSQVPASHERKRARRFHNHGAP